MPAAPLQADAFRRRRREALERLYAQDRQAAANRHAAMQVDDDGPTFWSEAGSVLTHYPAAAVDETLETFRDAGVSMGLVDEKAEVTWLRDMVGTGEAETALGRQLGGITQFVTGVATWLVPAGGAANLALRGGAAAATRLGAGRAVAAATEKATAKTVTGAMLRGATQGQAAGAAADFAAFDGMDERLLVMMNEVPALEGFVPDFLASADPDDSEWENRFYRALEGSAIGGLGGAVLGGLWHSLKLYAHARRAGRPGDVLDDPRKAAVRDTADRQAREEASIASRQALEPRERDPILDELDDDWDELGGGRVEDDPETAAAQAARWRPEGEGPDPETDPSEVPLAGEAAEDIPEVVRRDVPPLVEQAQAVDAPASLIARIAELEQQATTAAEAASKARIAAGPDAEPEQIAALSREAIGTAEDAWQAGEELRLVSEQLGLDTGIGPPPRPADKQTQAPAPGEPVPADKQTEAVGLNVRGERMPSVEAVAERLADATSADERSARRLAAGEPVRGGGPRLSKVLAQDVVVLRETVRQTRLNEHLVETRPDAALRMHVLERQAESRLADLEADPMQADRQHAAELAYVDWEDGFAAEWTAAKAAGWTPDEAAARPWRSNEDAGEWLLTRFMQGRDRGKLSPHLDEAAVLPPTRTTRRIEDVDAVIAAQPRSVRAATGTSDAHLARQRPEAMHGVVFKDERHRRGIAEDPVAVAQRPVEVWLRGVDQPEDYRAIVDEMAVHHAVDAPSEVTLRVDAAEQAARASRLALDEAEVRHEQAKTRMEQAKAGGRLPPAVYKRLKDAGEPTPKEKAYADLQAAKEALKDARLAKQEAEKAETAVKAEDTAAQRARTDARASVNRILGVAYRRMGTFQALPNRLRLDVDPRLALHALEDTLGAMQREAVSAVDPDMPLAMRAQAVRSMHKVHGLIAWLSGDEASVREALRRSALDAEPTDEAAAWTRREKTERLSDLYSRWRTAADDGEVAMVRSQIEEIRRAGRDPRRATMETAKRSRADQRLMAQSGGGKTARAQLARIAEGADAEDVLRAIGDWREEARYAWSGAERIGAQNAMRSVLQLRANSLLSAPKTIGMNPVSNALFLTIRIPERFLAGFAEHAASQTIPEAVAMAARETADFMAGFATGAQDGFRLANDAWRLRYADMEGQDAIRKRLREQHMDTMLDEFQAKDQFEETLRARQGLAHGRLAALEDAHLSETMRPMADGLVSMMSKAGEAPTQALQWGDMLTKGINYRMELNRLAHRQARERGLSGEAYRDAVQDFLHEPPRELRMEAVEYAHQGTFTNDPVRFVEWYTDMMDMYPALRLVTPFVRTPANVLTAGLQRMPGLGFAVRASREQWAAGGRPRAEVIGQQAMGTLVMGATAGLVSSGHMVGGAPTNEAFARTRRTLGIKEYSFKVGDTYLDYTQIFGPYAIVAMAASDAVEVMNGTTSREEVESSIGFVGVAKAVIGSAVDETFLRSWAEVAEAVQRNDKAMITAAARGLVNAIGTTAPYSSFMRRLSREFGARGVAAEHRPGGGLYGRDEGVFEALREEWVAFRRNWTDTYLGWLSADAERHPRRNVFGEPLSYYTPEGGQETFGHGVAAFLAPMAFSHADDRPLAQAMLASGYSPQWTRPSVPVRYPRSAEETVLQLDRDEHDTLGRLVGQRFEQRGTRLVSQARFQQATPPMQRKMLQQVRVEARKWAMGEVRRRHPMLRAREHDALRLLEIDFLRHRKGRAA